MPVDLPDAPPGGDPDPDASTGDAAPADGTPAGCSTYDYSYNGHKYRLVETGLEWTQAKSNCEADGGALLKIDSASEDQQVEVTLVGGPQEVWIGLSDADNDGIYVWTDGTPPSFTNWNGAPSISSPDCVVKNTYTSDGLWYTKGCGTNKAALCECVP